MKRLFYFLCISVAAFSSCEQTTIVQDIISQGMSVSQSEVEIYPGGGSVEILVTSGEPWSLSNPAEDWLTVTDANNSIITGGKAGSTQIILSADVNEFSRDRAATIEIGKERIYVSQKQPYLRVQHQKQWIDQEFNKGFFWYASKDRLDEYLTFKIESNTWWKVSGVNESYYVNQLEGEGDFNLIVIPKDINVSKKDRYMSLSIEGPDSRHKYSIDFVQDHLVFVLHNNHVTSCNEMGTSISGIVVESEVDWHLSQPETGWSVSGTRNGRGAAGSPVRTTLGMIQIYPNENRTATTHKIEFIPEDSDALAKNVTIIYDVEQDPFIFDIDGEVRGNCDFNNRDALDQSVSKTINSSADWYVEEFPDWIKIDDSTTDGSGHIGGSASDFIFAPKGQNLQLTSREGLITIKNNVNNMQIPIEVAQEKFHFTVQMDKNNNLEAVPDNEESEYRWFLLTTSGAWSIDSYPEWLYIPSVKGDYNDAEGHKVYFKALSVNTSEDNREGNVRIVSDLHKNTSEPVCQILKIVQNGFKFYLGESEGSEDDVIDVFSELGTDTKTIKVTSPTEWKAISNQDWVHVSPSSGKSTANVNISVDMNKTTVSRNGTIKFVNNDINNGRGKTILMNVSQAPYVFDIDFEETSLSLEPVLDQQTSTYVVKVVSSGRWQVESDASWVSLSSNGAANSGTFTFKVDNNTTSVSRSAKVIITNIDIPTNNKKTISIFQSGFVFSVSCAYTLDFNALSESQSFDMSYRCSGGLMIDKPDWVNCVDNGNGTITVKAENNLYESPRSGEIVVYNSYTLDRATFTVKQKGYEFSHNGQDTYSLKHKDNTNININITSTGEWMATSDASWLIVSPESGRGNGKITISAKDNDTKAKRNAILSLSCKDNPERVYLIYFYQEADSKKNS